MTITPLKLFHGAAPTPEADVYTSPGGVVLRRLVVANITGGAQAISISVAGQRVYGAVQVPANDVLPVLDVGVPLEAGETIRALTTGAGALIVLATGFSYT